NEFFVGRDSHLQNLKQWLARSQGHRRMSICGLGGCGKSALALEFAYRTMCEHPEYFVFWVPAISQETFELAYRKIGEFLRIPGITENNANVKQLLKTFLSSDNRGDWLIIVDNADDTNVLFDKLSEKRDSSRLIDYLPRCDRGSILFTTRGRKTAERLSQAHILELGDMGKTVKEARKMLSLQISNQALRCDNNAVQELLERLVYLPLAIMQASAFINQNAILVSEYVSHLRDANSEAELFSEHFEDPNRYDETESTIAKTWYISFNQIRKQDPLAADYLSFMACVDRINVPLSLLPTGDSAIQRIKSIGTLTGYALITERRQDSQQAQTEKSFDVHRLVHRASRWWLEERGEMTSWATKAQIRLKEVLPYGGHEERDIWTNYISHALFLAGPQNRLDKTAQASLLGRVGSCQSTLGQYLMAEPTYRRALRLDIELLGERHPDTLNSMDNLASVLFRQGKYEEAEAMHRQTLESTKGILGERHPNTLSSMNNLASVLDRQGKYEEAEAMHRQTLESRKEILGERHPDTLTSMDNLAWVLFRQGKYEEAEAMHRQTLESRKEILGERHPNTLSSMNNLASVLFRQGKYEEAEAMHRQTLELTKEILGERHPNTLSSMNNLASVLDSQGKYEEAEAMHRQTLESTKEILGERHPNTLISMNNLAAVLDSQGKYEEAEAMHRQTLESTKEILGERHPDTLSSMNNLASVLFRQGKYEEAEAMHRQTLELRKEILGERHPDTLSSMNNLALVLDSQGKYEEAEEVRAVLEKKS
ncbi:MAG: hypothetical protein MMC23_009769, partial [Stictis urceolatum]|nr:hypothetical protein [Stictis urceolata]